MRGSLLVAVPAPLTLADCTEDVLRQRLRGRPRGSDAFASLRTRRGARGSSAGAWGGDDETVSNATGSTSRASAILSTASSVADASPFSSRHMCERPTPARSARCVSAMSRSSASSRSRRAKTVRKDARFTNGSVTVAGQRGFPYQGI